MFSSGQAEGSLIDFPLFQNEKQNKREAISIGLPFIIAISYFFLYTQDIIHRNKPDAHQYDSLNIFLQFHLRN